MNSYITLDGKKYKTPHATWPPAEPIVPSTERMLLSDALDATYGSATWLKWYGEIEAPTSSVSNWGDIDDLRASIQKRQLLSFTDHYGDSYTVHVRGGRERSMTPKWDGTSNKLFVTVTLKARVT